jgi:hypothetical protein
VSSEQEEVEDCSDLVCSTTLDLAAIEVAASESDHEAVPDLATPANVELTLDNVSRVPNCWLLFSQGSFLSRVSRMSNMGVCRSNHMIRSTHSQLTPIL